MKQFKNYSTILSLLLKIKMLRVNECERCLQPITESFLEENTWVELWKLNKHGRQGDNLPGRGSSKNIACSRNVKERNWIVTETKGGKNKL